MDMKFYICESCGNLVAKVKDSGAPLTCCGQKMKELQAGTTDAAVEKHVPVIEVNGTMVTVTVGAVAHPMAPEHFIEWIVLCTDKGNQRKCLKPGDEPKACFALCEGEKVECAYAYCNLHGLWKAEQA